MNSAPSSARCAPTRAIPVALRALDRRVDDVVHERGLARSADAGDARRTTPSGISTSMFLRLCSVAPSDRAAAARPAGGVSAGTGIASSSRRYFAVSDRGSFEQSGDRAGVDDAAALLARAETEIDDLVGDANHVGVVLDDEHGVALVAQLLEDRDQPLVVARMQADRRLVEHVQRVDERRPERRRQIDALRLAARERRRQPIERQVVEPDVGEEAEPAANLAQDLVGDDRVLLAERERRRRTRPRPSPSARRPRRSSGRRRARRAPRAAAACRRSRGTSGSRDSG